MRSSSSPVCHSQENARGVRPAHADAFDVQPCEPGTTDVLRTSAGTRGSEQIAAPNAEFLRIGPRLYEQTLPLRLFCIRVINFLTNYVVAYVPSFAFRRLWYRRVLGIQLGRHVGVFMGTYMWFHGLRDNRRNRIHIGRNTRINRRCTLDLRAGLTIGENVSISPEVMILAASHDINNPAFSDVAGPVAIEDHAFIGTRAMILPGVTVGRGAVVLAGSQVSKDVPPLTVVGGTPARPIGMRNPSALEYELRSPLPLFE